MKYENGDCWHGNDRGKRNYSEKNLAERRCCYNKPYVHWASIEPGPATNGVHGTMNLCREQLKSYAYYTEDCV